MKKKYFAPEMEVVELNVSRTLLAGSVTGGDVLDFDAGEGATGLAPGMDGFGIGDLEVMHIPFN